MTLIETYRHLNNELKIIYDERESHSIALLLLEPLGFSNLSVALQPSSVLTIEQLIFLKDKMSEIVTGKPIQYVLGKTDFYGMKFILNEHVLIPRPETEELTDMIIRNHRNEHPIILDLGTGSGCIAVSLAKNILNSKVFGIDVSIDALTVAKKNAEENGVQIEFIIDDILNPAFQWEKNFFDIIVSNPPYVMKEDVKEMMPNVLDYEPPGALFADGTDPLLFYRRIFDFSVKHLKPKSYLYCEINEKLGRELEALALTYEFTDVKVIRDIRGKERILRGVKRLNC